MLKKLRIIVLIAGFTLWLASFFVPPLTSQSGLQIFLFGVDFLHNAINDSLLIQSLAIPSLIFKSLLVANLIPGIAWISNFTLILFYPPLLRLRWIAVIMPWLAIL